MENGFRPFARFLVAVLVLAVLFGSVPVAADQHIGELKRRISEKDAIVRQLQEQARIARGQLADIRQRERTLANEIYALERQIESLELEIRITEERIAETDLRIEQFQLEIEQLEEEIEVGRLRLSEILRTMQVAEEQLGAVELVFAGYPFSDLFDILRSAELLDSALATTLTRLKEAQRGVEDAKAAAEEERRQASVLRDELNVRALLLSGQQNERDALLVETQQEERNYQRILSDIERQQLAIQREVLELEAQLRRLINPSALPGDGVLQWPTASRRVTQGYGATASTGFINDAYEFHNGIDIGALTPGVIGDPVYAAASGTVVGVGSTGRYAYGRWIAIDHQNGLVTLYAHLSLQQVSTGQTVERGQVIGRMGSTGFSTGPHLHFTVYASETFRIEPREYGMLPLGGSLNPFSFLE